MKKILLMVCALLLLPVVAFAKTTALDDCAYATVDNYINHATPAGFVAGDTVTCPAGSWTWNTQLPITVGIVLQGGIGGATTITGALGHDTSYDTYMIKVVPATPASNEVFRITGFTFDMNNDSKGILLLNTSNTAMTNFRIDHNVFSNMVSYTYPMIEVHGSVYGVIDSNTASPLSHISFYGNQGNSWNNPPEGANTPYAYGTANTMITEDNVFTSDTTFMAGGWGGRYTSRYNTFNYSNSSGLFPWFDAHGNQPSGVYAMMGTEFYGNLLIADSITAGNGVRAFAHRGGKSLFLFNGAQGTALTTTPTIQAFEEYDDAISATTNTEPQRVNDSYYFNNRKGATAFGLEVLNWEAGGTCGAAEYPTGNCPSYDIAANVNFWNYTATFDGTAGVGCGAIGDRPATCTTGVGYWATTQSCTDLTDYIGTTPTAAIAGTLYKCTATDTWTAYYTPYSYPHPLRGETTTRTITSSKVGAVGTLSYEGESIVNDGDNSQIYTASNIPNGWKVTWSGTGGCTGNGTTCQVLNVTADKTVIATFTEIKLMPW